jgi:hypothetical protein
METLSWPDRLAKVFKPDGDWVEPLSERWFQARRGRISSSTRAVTLATRKPQPWHNLMDKLDRELSPDYVRHEITGVSSLEWGRRHELCAIANIELALGTDIIEPGMMFRPEHPYWEATPDGMIDGNITLEIKCPIKPEVHLATLYDKDAIKRIYKFQVQAEIWVARAERGMFVSFDPRQPLATQLAVVDIAPDNQLQDAFSENIVSFRELFETRSVLQNKSVRPVGIAKLF